MEAQTFSKNNVVLQVKNISKIYSNSTKLAKAVDDVSLDIFQGETLALLGVNGAGKTTLSSMLVSLHPPTSGDVIYKGQSIYNNLSDYRKAIGYCPQRQNLDIELNVEENLLFAGRYYLVPEQILQERVIKLLEEFDLKKHAQASIKTLSGGFKQRLLIARALVHNPCILVLDEPTIALDPHVRHALWEKIKNLKQQGITTIITTHYIEEAEILADRVCIMDAGKIILVDKPENLKLQFSKSNLEAVFLHLLQEDVVE